jgi:tetratricopeptide (TPR) repeat protein
MAERIEEPEAEAPEPSPSGAAGLAAAMAAALSRRKGTAKNDPELDSFLREQTRLARLQTEHLHEQREVQLSHLKLRRFNEWMKAALQVMTACVGATVVVVLGIMAWSASHEHGVVVEAFSVPPDLAARGLTGQVVAGKFLDDLQRMEEQTVTRRAPSTYANNWSGEAKVEIPETGVSIGELHRLLVDWLGRNTRIEGDIYRTPQGLTVAARAGAIPAGDQAGAETDLDALIQAAAEDIYAETQPYRYGIYLDEKGDIKDVQHAAAQFKELLRTGSAEDRMWSYIGLADTQRLRGEFQGAIGTYSAGIAEFPHFTLYYNTRSSIEHFTNDERALADARTGREMLKRFGDSYMRRGAGTLVGQQFDETEAYLLGDYAKAADSAVRAYDRDSTGTNVRLDALVDPALDHASLATLVSRSPVPRDARQTLTATTDEGLARLTHAFAMGDWAGVVDAYTAYNALDTSQLAPGDRLTRTLQASRLTAIAQARLGQFARAQALIATTPPDCYRCVDARGVIASAAGDWAVADRLFAEAERLAPSPPFAYADQAQSRLARGDLTGAIALLQTVYAKSPHYADALELWGEALARRGDYAGAAAKYAEADRYAPQWGRNHLMWGESMMLSGRYREARAQYEAANRLDLSKPDRAALGVLLARTESGPLHG